MDPGTVSHPGNDPRQNEKQTEPVKAATRDGTRNHTDGRDAGNNSISLLGPRRKTRFSSGIDKVNCQPGTNASQGSQGKKGTFFLYWYILGIYGYFISILFLTYKKVP